MRNEPPLAGAVTRKEWPASRDFTRAEPIGRKPVSRPLPSTHCPPALRYCTWKRIRIVAPFLSIPGIDARRPMVSGDFFVSQMFTVAHTALLAADAEETETRHA